VRAEAAAGCDMPPRLCGGGKRRGEGSTSCGFSLLLSARRPELIEGRRSKTGRLAPTTQRLDDQELAPVLRRLAASLVAEIPEDTTEALRG